MEESEKEIGIVIASHGSLGASLIEAAEVILGKQTNYCTLALYPEDSIDEFKSKIKEALIEQNSGKGVLCFVDLLGGSPCNAVLQLMMGRGNINCLTGVNLPMLLAAFTQRSTMTLEQLELECLSVGNSSHQLVEENFRKLFEAFPSDENF